MVGKNFPYLTAELDGKVVGYAYASLYRTRPAYRHTMEDSIYVHKDFGGRGIGKQLLEALIEACEKAGCRQLIAVIGDSDNHGSVKLHVACGFEMVGVMKAVGFKFGRWVDSVYTQRDIGEGQSTLPPERDNSGNRAACQQRLEPDSAASEIRRRQANGAEGHHDEQYHCQRHAAP